jgi:flavin reductase (DIM6/NTAB) family NADH-FMN oxidoreductase RutF
MGNFSTVPPEKLNENVFTLLGSEWMLITAGTIESYNMMTASWGGMGVLWNKNVCYIVMRPQRHTRTFMEKHDIFTLSFFHEKYRNVLKFCGSHSGRDVDKTAETGIAPVASAHGGVYFAEARLIMECRKIYYQDLDPSHFLDSSIAEQYTQHDYHRMYIGEIVTVMIA